MKIAFLIGDFPSLSETFILDQIVGLIQQGCQVDIYANRPSLSKNKHPKVDQFNLMNHVHYYPDIPSFYPIRLLKFIILSSTNFFKDPILVLRSLNLFRHKQIAASLRLFYATVPFFHQRPQYDIIQCHFGNNGVLGLKLRQIGAISGKLCTTFHGRDMSHYIAEAGDRVYSELFREGDLFLPISDYWRRRLIELGCDKNKIIVHRMGIDCQQFTFVPRSKRSNGEVKLITVARLVEKKGIEYGIRAIAQLKERYPNIRYTIVGDGPLRESLEHLTVDLKVNEWVEFLGWRHRDEVIELLNSAEIFLAPSITSSDGDQEGIPVSLMEAMAMGLLTMSTRHSGIPELIEDRVSGFLAPEKDVNVLIDVISHVTEHPKLWQKIGYEGRRKVEKDFNNINLNDQLFKIFNC